MGLAAIFSSITMGWFRRICSGCLAVFAVASAISAVKGYLGLQPNTVLEALNRRERRVFAEIAEKS
jgi:hypothetical protein